MDKEGNLWENPITYLIIALVLIGTIYGYKNFTGSAVMTGQYDDFAKYLTEQGVIMYGTEWCPHCQNQKELFGDSFQYIDYVDCDKNPSECSEAGVQGYPTWVIYGQSYAGTLQISRLIQLSGYTGQY